MEERGAAEEALLVVVVVGVSGPLRAQVHTNQIHTLTAQFDAVYFFAAQMKK